MEKNQEILGKLFHPNYFNKLNQKQLIDLLTMDMPEKHIKQVKERLYSEGATFDTLCYFLTKKQIQQAEKEKVINFIINGEYRLSSSQLAKLIPILTGKMSVKACKLLLRSDPTIENVMIVLQCPFYIPKEKACKAWINNFNNEDSDPDSCCDIIEELQSMISCSKGRLRKKLQVLLLQHSIAFKETYNLWANIIQECPQTTQWQACETILHNNPSDYELISVILYGRKKQKFKAWKMLNNPSSSHLAILVRNGSQRFQKKAWEQLVVSKSSNLITSLYTLILDGPDNYKEMAWGKIKEIEFDTFGLCHKSNALCDIVIHGPDIYKYKAWEHMIKEDLTNQQLWNILRNGTDEYKEKVCELDPQLCIEYLIQQLKE